MVNYMTAYKQYQNSMFQNLTDRLTSVLDRIRGKGFISESDLNQAMREIRIALLEADVALPVVKAFIDGVKEKALGQEVLKSISPGQMIVKLVHDHLVGILSDENSALNLNAPSPCVILMVGLQGSGKTTTSGKIANFISKKMGKKILLASLDVYRPAAREQLRIIGQQLNIDTLSIVDNELPLDITKRALHDGKIKGYDIIILDTAGRLHIDDVLMDEIVDIKKLASPIETLLVVDAMTGQDAVNIAQSFNEKIGITGTVLTRIDGDSRGGAALSMRHITGRPIKFLGYGEKLDHLELFDPERIAGRILDMGDIVGLVEKAAENFKLEEVDDLQKKMMKGTFSLNDFKTQLEQMEKMGGMSGLMAMMPGFNKIKDQMATAGVNDKTIRHQIAIIQSMTPAERRDPNLLNASRKKRIAKGSGREVQDVNKLLKQHDQMKSMMKSLKNMEKSSLMKQALSSMFGGKRPF